MQGNGRLRAGGSHPDSRAVMFEEVKYSRRKILDLLSALSGFRQAASIVRSMSGQLVRGGVLFSSVWGMLVSPGVSRVL